MTVSRREPHLGELAAALVDGALDHGARDRALVHLARCDECRAEVDAQRQLKAQLRSLLTPPAPPGLVDRLRTLPDRVPTPSAAELPPDRFGARFRAAARPGAYGRALDGRTLRTVTEAVTAAPLAQLRPVPLRPPADGVARPSGEFAPRPGAVPAAAGRGPGRRRRARYAATAAGGLAAFALAIGAVVAAGEAPTLEPVVPQVGTFLYEHGKVTGGMPGPAAEAGVAEAVNVGR